MTLTATVGREAELDSIRAFIDAVPRGPSALTISGEAGIGKTILWEAGVEAARDQGFRVLMCRGIEAEASLSFAASVGSPRTRCSTTSLPRSRGHAGARSK